MLIDAQFVRLLVGDELDPGQRHLAHSRQDPRRCLRRGSAPFADQLQGGGQQGHLRACRLCTGFADQSGTTEENNTGEPTKAPAADYKHLTHGLSYLGTLQGSVDPIPPE